MTAITFVAFGTSLPDLFASMQAARDDPSADNSIGNVTGSNSVNVFLGLGLSWLLGALYWRSNGATAESAHSWRMLTLSHAFSAKAGASQTTSRSFARTHDDW